MNVLALLPSFRPSDYLGPVGGGEISNRRLLESLAGRGHGITVYAFNAGGSNWMGANGLRVIDGGLGSPDLGGRVMGALLARARLHKKLPALTPDVILTTAGTVATGLRASRQNGVPVAVLVRAIRDIMPVAGSAAKTLARRLVYGNAPWTRAPYLIANSRFLRDYCRKNGFNGPGWVVYPPFDDEPLETPWPSSVSKVVMIGSAPNKGIETFISLARRMPQIDFKVIGDRSVRPGERRLEGNVTRVGWTNAPLDEIDSCDALLMPTRYHEAFGRAAVEAIRRRKYVLASSIGGLPEAVGDSRLLIDPDDLDAWQDSLTRLVRDPGAFRAAMDRAFEAAMELGIEAQTACLEQALCEMASPSSAHTQK
jgi:Glycosyltransferase